MTTKQESVQPKPTLLQAVVPLLGLLICLGGGYAVMKLPTQVCLLGAAAVAGFVALWIGIRWEDMLEGMIEKVTASFGSILVMICVGAMIASWIFSGTIPMLIYYGIKLINPRFLFVTGFLVCAIISTFTGTSFGSAGTAGVAGGHRHRRAPAHCSRRGHLRRGVWRQALPLLRHHHAGPGGRRL